MAIRTYVLAVIFIFAALATAFGEEEQNPLMRGSPLTLEESIEIALEKNPTLRGAQGAIKEAKYQRLGAVSDFLPQVDTQAHAHAKTPTSRCTRRPCRPGRRRS